MVETSTTAAAESAVGVRRRIAGGGKTCDKQEVKAGETGESTADTLTCVWRMAVEELRLAEPESESRSSKNPRADAVVEGRRSRATYKPRSGDGAAFQIEKILPGEHRDKGT